MTFFDCMIANSWLSAATFFGLTLAWLFYIKHALGITLARAVMILFARNSGLKFFPYRASLLAVIAITGFVFLQSIESCQTTFDRTTN